MPDPMLLFLGLFFGLLFIVFAYIAGWLDFLLHRRQQVPEASPPAWPKKQSAEELERQKVLCADVAKRSRAAAAAIRAYSTTLGGGNGESLSSALASLQAVVSELESSGALGVIATPELCNALLETDTLKELEELQTFPEEQIAQRSTRVFQYVIPRIWSF